MAYLAAILLFAAVVGILAPIFAACAAIVRLRASLPTPVAMSQRRVDLSILLLAALGPILWVEAHLLRHGRKGPIPFDLVILLLLCALASLLLAGTGSGPGRSVVLAAHAFFLASVVGLAIWSIVLTHLDRHRPFFGELLPVLQQTSRTTSRTGSNIPRFTP